MNPLFAIPTFFFGVCITEDGCEGAFTPYTPIWFDGTRWQRGSTAYSSGPVTIIRLKAKLPPMIADRVG
jgi:hypothetical protein